jgi:hypothetical protein
MMAAYLRHNFKKMIFPMSGCQLAKLAKSSSKMPEEMAFGTPQTPS